MTADGATFTILHNFTNTTDGRNPSGPLVRTADGSLYMFGHTSSYPFEANAVLKMAPDGTVTILHTFATCCPGGVFGPVTAPEGRDLNGLVFGADGNLYGTAADFGTYGGGTVFMMTPSGVVTILHQFGSTPSDISNPVSLIVGNDGNFYGTAGGTTTPSVVFKMVTDGTSGGTTLTVIGTSPSMQPACCVPAGRFIQATDGNFYGLTQGISRGPVNPPDFGTVFEVAATGGGYVLKHEFVGADGWMPAVIIEGRDGNIYGVTASSTIGPPASAAGTVFEMAPDGTTTVLYSLTASSDGRAPGSLIQGVDGSLYGMTGGGGAGFGTIFRLDLANTPAGANVLVRPVDSSTGTTPVSVTFSDVEQAGNTSLTTSSDGPTVPAGFQLGSPATYYAIATKAVVFTGNIQVCIDYGTTTFPSDSLHLLHFDGEWFDTTTSIDQATHTICGTTTSLSPFVVAAQVDMTPPVTTASLSSEPNSNGWNSGNVIVSLAAADNGPGASGVKQITYSVSGPQGISAVTVMGASASVSVSQEGVTTITFFATDNAGNGEAPKTLTVRIDKTPPRVSVVPSTPILWPPNGKLVQDVFSGQIGDALSGIDAGSATFRVVDEYGTVQPTGPIVIGPGGNYVFSAALEASRLGGDLDGRSYQVVVSVNDEAGNLVSVSAVVIVPHDAATSKK